MTKFSGKYRELLLALSLLMFFNCCRKLEYIEIDVNPQLQITVINESNKLINGASVKLYYSKEDFLANDNPIEFLLTDENGKVLFTELDETIYFFYIEKERLNNFYGTVTFSEPLNKNEIRAISCTIK